MGVIAGGLLLYASGIQTPALVKPDADAPPNMAAGLAYLFVFPPLIIMTTLTSTFAQFRSARYFLSRLKLDGPIDLGAILQSQNTGPKRGEGLAQAFDLDAF